METVKLIAVILAGLSAVLYAYQFAFIPLQWILSARKKQRDAALFSVPRKTCAVLISARNEERVIGDLIKSITRQTYDNELIKVFVVADNCSDGTAKAASELGAVVYERTNTEEVGKGYALDFLMRRIKADYPEGFDLYFVFDADNLLCRDYFEKMVAKAEEGFDIVTSCRNSKNFGDSWVSSAYGLMFMRSSRYLNHTRSMLGTSCYAAGTGYLFTRKIAEEQEGWPYHMLTEDIEFSADQILKGRIVGYCCDAEFYDEQPVTFRLSCRQRLRWAQGYIQVLKKYGGSLLKKSLKGDFSCYDLNMCIMPAFLVTVFSLVVDIILSIMGFTVGRTFAASMLSVLKYVLAMYAPLFAIALITALTEWKRIRTTPVKKILAVFTSPIFMIAYTPIAFVSLFTKPEWKPIEHCVDGKNLSMRRKEEQLPE